MPIAYIGIGSNMGDKAQNCIQAVKALRGARGIGSVRMSGLYRTEPVGYTAQDEFVNCAAEIETDLSPRELLDLCKEIEGRLGRRETFHWGPRVIDLDILLYGQEIIDEADLKVPHPEMHRRRFVLAPLAELAPDAVHPQLGKVVGRLLAESDDSSKVVPLTVPCAG